MNDAVPTIVLATEKRLGHMSEQKIVQLGASIDELATFFERPPGIESQLLKEPVKV